MLVIYFIIHSYISILHKYIFFLFLYIILIYFLPPLTPSLSGIIFIYFRVTLVLVDNKAPKAQKESRYEVLSFVYLKSKHIMCHTQPWCVTGVTIRFLLSLFFPL